LRCSLRRASVLLDYSNFFMVKGSTILVEDIMEPDLWFRCTLWGSPWIYSLGLSTNKTPVYCTNILLMKHRDVRLELLLMGLAMYSVQIVGLP
jgi:hypothetical protein